MGGEVDMRFYFTSEEEKELIINNNSDKELIALHYDIGFGYIDFSSETEIDNMQRKIEVLEAKNKSLEKELTQIQASIASLMSMTLEEK